MTRDNMFIEQAEDRKATPFDYVIVGSGAGGGPLAARLALGGCKVLVIEAGVDPAIKQDTDEDHFLTRAVPEDGDEKMRQVYAVPAFHGPSTEDPRISWEFSVRHYSDNKRQEADTKYCSKQDPSANGKQGRGGIQYPRAAAVGGCTAHHAMIVIRPNDADWDRLAEDTDDASWHSDNMQGYFPKIENCLYYSVYSQFAGPVIGALQWIAKQLAPRSQLDPVGHGFDGWQKTSFINPLVIAAIVRGDKTFVRLLIDVALSRLATREGRSMLYKAVTRFQILQFLDPNVRSPDFTNRNHLSLISIGTDGRRRFGLRDHLLDVSKRYPDNLVILNPAHATRILFEADDKVPRAVGVEVRLGAHLYGARSAQVVPDKAPKMKRLFARREVIVCGGAFNTPQLLMLSGIGDRDHLDENHIEGPRDSKGAVVAPIVHLPGVGMNLQDRYEVSVITTTKEDFSTLKGVTFQPGARDDPKLMEWLDKGSGLYSTNGGAIALMMSSKGNTAAQRSDPDLFIFGVPAAFRGYYWGWSRELLSKLKGAPPDSRNLWSWVILKAYTNNTNGSVRLRTDKPFDTPQIDFHSFDDPAVASRQKWEADLQALEEAIAKVREINGHVTVFNEEVQPRADLTDDELRKWIKNEAWGHHACGTCRIGSDAWRADTLNLEDRHAVLDSRFRVHGVKGLRVVDTSVFPRIPGYFIVTPTFMISEKAADVLLADTDSYPHALEAAEAKAIVARRAKANRASPAANPNVTLLPDDTIGLALSGGGIRSATFCLGVMQALAKRKLLRDVDIVSSVSGGNHTGSFVGRLFTRLPSTARDPARRVEETLTDPASPEVGWLRQNAQYIAGGGRRDVMSDIAVILRNLASIHVWLGTLLFGAFGVLRWIASTCPLLAKPPTIYGVILSSWWWLPVIVLTFGVLPPAIGYWLTLRDNLLKNWRAWLPLVTWLVLLGCAIYGLALPAIADWSVVAIVVLVIAWIEQEVVRWGTASASSPRAEQQKVPQPAAKPPVKTTVVRNRLTRMLGTALVGFVVSLLWVALDTAARKVTRLSLQPVLWSMAGAVPLLPMLRGLAVTALKRPSSGQQTKIASGLVLDILLGVLAFVIVFALLLFLDALVYIAFDRDVTVSHWLVVTALLTSVVVGRTLAFVNLSSLQQAYSQKLVRTFLGASNDARVRPAGTDKPVPVNVSSFGDDIDFDTYHPEHNGGPLHLVNACVNNTVDPLSGNQLHDDKGMAMCAGPAGMSVGRRFHALWAARDDDVPAHLAPVKAVRVAPDPHQFHVLERRDHQPALVERLRLGQWMSISGAAFTTGTGRNTRLAQSLLLGLFNVRIGYWWNSGIAADLRPGRYPPGPWRRLKSLPAAVFTLHAKLFDEWRAYFEGPAARLWYLSDGGHFDNTGLYELIRRRLPMMIAVDATADPKYTFESLSLLTRQVRLDFGATIDWLDLKTMRVSTTPNVNAQAAPWDAFKVPDLPPWFRAHLDPQAIGRIDDLKRTCLRGAALARITYEDANDPYAADNQHRRAQVSWLLLIKASLFADLPIDVRHYAQSNDAFPNQTTVDQFFDDNQWEAYRMLGKLSGEKVFK
ncbi:GMC oxidoreductase [Paraburkholderia sp. SIMBA_054]|uniref:GMC oxidoreductase n=1 Tax=Paraburkholderia sp. SIMBA_054 TaxID=3085795 RepID=UPI00397CCF1B